MMYKLACLALMIVAVTAFPKMPDEVARMIENGELDARYFSNNVSVDASPFGQCTTVKLRGCQQKFNGMLGIDGNVDWTNPAVFARAVNSILLTGRGGYRDVCNARAAYQGCLGHAYFACIDPIFLIKSGLSKDIAFDYLGIMFQLEFNCIQGFSVGIKDWPCIVHTIDVSSAAITTCVNAYKVAIQGGTNVCVATQTLTTCYSKVFTKGCPPGSQQEAGWFACEQIKHSMLSRTCDIPCKITGTN